MKQLTGIALLGAGRMAKVHAAAINAAGGRIVTVFDPVTAAAESLAAQNNASVAATAEAAIGHPDVQAVVIATSSDTHVELILAASKAAKPVLCEKPLASSLDEARRCISLIGDEAAKRVFLGFNRRFDRGHASVREAVLRGDIGRLEQLTLTSRDPLPPPLGYIPRSGGLFRDMMIHDFDMARGILGQDNPIISVTAHGSSVIDPEIGRLGDVDTASVTMETRNGTLITILNSRRCSFGFDQRVEAFGSEGMVISDNPRQSGYTRYSAASPGTQAPILEFFMERYGPSYTEEMRLFLACILSGSEMPVNAIDGLQAAWLAEAATHSLKQGKTVPLTHPNQDFNHD